MSFSASPATGRGGYHGGREFTGPSYRESQLWLEFQRCSYGACDGSAAILGPSHPCKVSRGLQLQSLWRIPNAAVS